ncbi:MAG: 2,3-bisphosphoglycerate-independent phosphoglycerate mutase [Firmicutes bacterium]|jgi:2,3-bisphosphoglycerate-independent phosphoglycerate mutase|nr:2,3-bisphosphoglycerate-independent phosphoglycerate mutase [Bacillota bacterium]
MAGRRPIVLTVLDGWGASVRVAGNAVALARIPNFQRLLEAYPHTTLPAHGQAVGLPEGQMGGSEVGHLCLGAGRVVYQDLSYLNNLIDKGEFQRNRVILDAMKVAAESGRSVHLMGLVSPGGVHSHQDHIYVLVGMARESGVRNLYIHAFLDGRDVPPASAVEYLENLQNRLDELGLGEVATVSGRYYAMDRDNRWDRTKLAWDALVHGQGVFAHSAIEAVRRSYAEGVTDEFVLPVVIVRENGERVAQVEDGDSVIFFNFRADRARQLTKAFMFDEFHEFDRGSRPKVNFVCLMEYLKSDIPVAFSPPDTTDVLAEVLSRAGKRQLKVAETEKFAHVTFFFNGGREEPFPGEDRVLIPSPKVATYDQAPEMSARAIAAEVVRRVESGDYDFILVNFANGDMVGHTGDLDAAVKAVETVDECLGQIWDAISAAGGVLIVTSDHGNADEMVDPEKGTANTAHSLNPVPFILAGAGPCVLRRDGDFGDVAPTILELMGVQQPAAMSGKSLIAGYGA